MLGAGDNIGPASPGDIVTGKVIELTAEEVVVDVGGKGEGRAKRSEFTELGEDVKVGDTVEVKIIFIDHEEGTSRLSRQRVVQDGKWREVREAFQNQKPVSGTVIDEVKGGFKVDLGLPFTAFLPRSQAGLSRRTTLEELQGKTYEFEVKELDRKRKNVVVSRRGLMEGEQLEKRKKTLENLAVGSAVEGVIKNITTFGVFVDIGGIDGLIMLGDLSWSGFVKDASKIVKKGEKVTVKVLEYDSTQEPPRIRLGLKQMQGEPWDNLPENLKPGAIVTGTVKSFTNFGAFIELAPGVDGLAHISELAWVQHVKHPSELFTLGSSVNVKILSVEPDRKKISLSLKQTSPDPWTVAFDEYPVHTRIAGKVTGVTNFGVFVRLPSGIEGMIHRSDLSWDDEDGSEVQTELKEGDEVNVVVLRVDSEAKKISLGLKQTQSDPWLGIQQKYQKNRTVEGPLVRATPEGAFIQLEEGLEGFVALSDLAAKRPAAVEEIFKIGDIVRARVIRLERKGKRISLSVKDLLRKEEAEDVKDFMAGQRRESSSVTLGDYVADEETAARLKALLAGTSDTKES